MHCSITVLALILPSWSSAIASQYSCPQKSCVVSNIASGFSHHIIMCLNTLQCSRSGVHWWPKRGCDLFDMRIEYKSTADFNCIRIFCSVHSRQMDISHWHNSCKFKIYWANVHMCTERKIRTWLKCCNKWKRYTRTIKQQLKPAVLTIFKSLQCIKRKTWSNTSSPSKGNLVEIWIFTSRECIVLFGMHCKDLEIISTVKTHLPKPSRNEKTAV